MILRGFEVTGQRTVDNFIQPGDADNVNETIIDRIEISKGPNAILSPAGAPGADSDSNSDSDSSSPPAGTATTSRRMMRSANHPAFHHSSNATTHVVTKG